MRAHVVSERVRDQRRLQVAVEQIQPYAGLPVSAAQVVQDGRALLEQGRLCLGLQRRKMALRAQPVLDRQRVARADRAIRLAVAVAGH